MTGTAPLIDYASDAPEQPADRLLRRIVAWTAVVYAGMKLVGVGLHVALNRGWAASPNTMTWGFSEWQVPWMTAHALATGALLGGGVLLLRRSPASVVVLRAAVACTIGLAVLGLVLSVRGSAVGASYWSTPAAAGVRALQFLDGLWLPALIVLLTLPPLARRMV